MCIRDRLYNVRYVLTLDADSQLPRDAARTLVGILAHPLNRPHFDPEVGRVTCLLYTSPRRAAAPR